MLQEESFDEGSGMNRQKYLKALNEEFYSIKALMNDTPCGFCRMKIEQGKSAELEYINDGFCRLLNMSREEVVLRYGKNPIKSIYPDDLDEVKNALTEMYRNSGRFNEKFRLKFGRNDFLWVQVFGRIAMTETGERFLNLYIADISEQIEREKQIKELLDNLPCGAGFYEFSGDSLTAIYLNNRYMEMVGRVIENPTEADVLEMVSPDDREKMLQEIREAIVQRRDIVCDIHIQYGRKLEYRLYHVEGRIMNRDIGVYAIYATYTTISTEKLSLKAMMPVIMEAIMKSTTDLTFVKDKNFDYICCSPAFAQMAGLASEKDVVGKSDYELFEDRKMADKFRFDDCRLLEEERPLIDCVELIPSNDGLEHYSCTSKYLLYDNNGNPIGIYGVGRDITESHVNFNRLQLLTDNVP